jgi:hypothetical protein
MFASNKKVDIKLPSGVDFTVCAEDWEDAGASICCELLTDADIEDIARKLKAQADANPYWDKAEDFETNNERNGDQMDELWRDYENITIAHKVFYFEDMTEDEYAKYNALCEAKDETGVKTLCEQVYNRIKGK